MISNTQKTLILTLCVLVSLVVDATSGQDKSGKSLVDRSKSKLLFPIRLKTEHGFEVLFVDETGSSIFEKKFVDISPAYPKNLAASDVFFAVTPNGRWNRVSKDSISELPEYSEDRFEVVFQFGKHIIAETLLGQLVLDSKNKKWKEMSFKIDSRQTLVGQELYVAQKSEKSGYVDSEFNVKIPFDYEIAKPFSEGKAFVKKEGECYFIDTKEQKSLSKSTSEGMIGYLLGYPRVSEGLTIGLIGEQLIFVDTKGKPWDKHPKGIIARDSFYGGVAIGSDSKNKKCYIDKNGKLLTKPRFSYAGRFQNKRAIVVEEGVVKTLNQDGELVKSVVKLAGRQRMSFGIYANDRILIRIGKRTLMLDGKGKVVKKWNSK